MPLNPNLVRFDDSLLQEGDTFACEITSLPQKLYQLERGERLHEARMPGISKPKVTARPPVTPTQLLPKLKNPPEEPDIMPRYKPPDPASR